MPWCRLLGLSLHFISFRYEYIYDQSRNSNCFSYNSALSWWYELQIQTYYYSWLYTDSDYCKSLPPWLFVSMMGAAEPASFDTIGETIRTNHYEGSYFTFHSWCPLHHQRWTSRRVIHLWAMLITITGKKLGVSVSRVRYQAITAWWPF